MDQRLSKALEFANYSLTLSNQKRILQEKFFEDCLYFAQGRQFTVTPVLINFVSLLSKESRDNSAIIIDDNNTPVIISDLESFLSDILECYSTASQEYHDKYLELSKKRSVESLIDE